MLGIGGRRIVLLVVALAFVLGGLPQPAKAALVVCHQVQGVVRDPFGDPVDAATIQTDSPCVAGQPGVPSAPTGAYVIGVKGTEAGATAAVWASKPNFATSPRQTIVIEPEGGTSSAGADSAATPGYRVRGSDITLYFDVFPSLDKPAVRSGDSRMVTVVTLAPPTGSSSGRSSKVLVEAPDGSFTSLTALATTNGSTTWAAPVVMPAATTEGSRAFLVCAVGTTFAGNCTAAATVGAPTRLSAVRQQLVLVDNTPPALSSVVPDAFEVITTTAFAASWNDLDSSLDAPATVVKIDGSPIPSTTSGLTTQASLASQALGVHMLSVSVADRAGNVASEEYLFTLGRLTGSPATASLRSMTVPVTPPGGVPRTTVVFSNPVVDVPATSLILPATTRVGVDQATRSFNFGAVDVIFRNEAGLTTTVSATASPSSDVQRFAALAPSASPLSVTMPSHTTTTGSISVSVPTGYTTPGATAQLVADSAPLGVPTAPTSLLKPALDGTTPVWGSFDVCAKGTLDADLSCAAGTPATAYVSRSGSAYGVMLGVAGEGLTDPSENDRTPPECDGCDAPPTWPAGVRQYGGGVSFGCPTVVIAGLTRNLCSGDARPPSVGPIGSYLNAFVSHSEGHFPVWRQDHTDAGADICPNGRDAERVGRSYRLAANNLAADGSGDPVVSGTWVDENVPLRGSQVVKLGAVNGNDQAGFEDRDLAYTLTNEDKADLTLAANGRYVPALSGQWISAAGVVDAAASASATSNAWEFSDAALPLGDGLAADVQVFMGTDYLAPAVLGTYSFQFNNAFHFILDSSDCT